jgi:hypothetical protein
MDDLARAFLQSFADRPDNDRTASHQVDKHKIALRDVFPEPLQFLI